MAKVEINTGIRRNPTLFYSVIRKSYFGSVYFGKPSVSEQEKDWAHGRRKKRKKEKGCELNSM
jgi:hypothetical protein